MSCNCNYALDISNPCVSCLNVANVAATNNVTQKRIWQQVRTGSGMYTMNLSALTSGAAILASGSTTHWNQRSDRILASVQPLIPTRGNSLKSTLTSDRPGAGSPGGSGVDVKHDSYARYLNRKKAATIKTQTQQTVPVKGNKTKMTGLLANSINCCT